MARTNTDGVAQPSIDAILRSLADRPNVDATLILSRKDGSIIRATGFATTGGNKGSQTAAGQPSQVLQQSDELSQEVGKSHSDDTINTEGGDSASPAELLAHSVFHYVDAASKLAEVVTSVSVSGSEGGNNFSRRMLHKSTTEELDSKQHEMDTGRNVSDVQLLRLRTTQHEVIIFPDFRYLCCVVQHTTKQGKPSTTR